MIIFGIEIRKYPGPKAVDAHLDAWDIKQLLEGKTVCRCIGRACDFVRIKAWASAQQSIKVVERKNT